MSTTTDWPSLARATARGDMRGALLARVVGELGALRARLGSEASEEAARRLGWLLGVLASSPRLDFLRARRDADGVLHALELVAGELTARGLDVRLEGPAPRVVGGPDGNWRLPLALMRVLWTGAEALAPCRARFAPRADGGTSFELRGGPAGRGCPSLPPILRGTALDAGAQDWILRLPPGWIELDEIELEGGERWSG